MSQVKVAVLGAGSFVFGPSLLKDAIIERRLGGIELALVDTRQDAAELMAGVGQRMAREMGVDAAITACADRATALDGADFVICCAADDLARRFAADCEIIQKYCPGHRVSEFGGIAGISYSLRQVALIQQIVADMKRYCPRAWLLNLANPLPRVLQAARDEGARAVGFCSVSLSAYGLVWKALHGQALEYPFEPARSKLDITMAGLNHFAWILRLADAETGNDMYPVLREKIRTGALDDQPLTKRVFEETGYLLAAGDNHVRDFLEPHPDVPPRMEPWHGSAEERSGRMAQLKDVAEGRAPLWPLFQKESWERPMSLIGAMAFGKPASFHALNVANNGYMPALPATVFVEMPALAARVGPVPERIQLPFAVQPLCRRTAAMNDLIVRGARWRKRELVDEAIDLDPTIIDKSAGRQAVTACIEAHQDVLPHYQ